MPQTNYGYVDTTPLYAGQVASSFPRGIRHYKNDDSVVIPFGCVVVKGTGDRDAVIPSTGSGVLLGIAVGAQIYESAANAAGDVGYPVDREMDVLAQGEVAVIVEEAVAPGDSVFYRFTANGTGKTRVGYGFRNDADNTSGQSPVATCAQITNARWIKGASAAGEIAVLAINLP